MTKFRATKEIVKESCSKLNIDFNRLTNDEIERIIEDVNHMVNEMDFPIGNKNSPNYVVTYWIKNLDLNGDLESLLNEEEIN